MSIGKVFLSVSLGMTLTKCKNPVAFGYKLGHVSKYISDFFMKNFS